MRRNKRKKRAVRLGGLVLLIVVLAVKPTGLFSENLTEKV